MTIEARSIAGAQFVRASCVWKTTNSRRTIDLDSRTVAVLRAWRRQQLKQQMSTGRRGHDGFILTRRDGEPIHPDFFPQSWERLVRESGLRRIRLSDLRHTDASIPPQGPAFPWGGRQRTPRPQQPSLHDDRVPTRPPGHAG